MGPLTLVVVTYLGVVVQAQPFPVDLADCERGISQNMPGYLASWARVGFDPSAIKITCEPIGAVKLIEGARL